MKENSIKKLTCSISLDLDNLWAYLKIHGDNEWKTYPSYLNIFVPYVINLLNELKLKITFFVVGKDAVIDENKDAIQMISLNNHEINNHSFNHDSWLHLYSKDEIRKEIINTEEAIINICGQKPIGFRGPGFSWSFNLLETLLDLGYIFDASTLPSFIGPVARLYYFRTAKLNYKERKDRNELFGKLSNGFLPLRPYFWELNSTKHLLEIPVSTIPYIKMPFHLSYLIYLNNISPFLMRGYLNMAINFCLLTKTEPSFLLHPLDLISGDQIKTLAFFPGMNVKSSNKMKLFIEVINELKTNFDLITMGTLATSSVTTNLKIKKIKPAQKNIVI